MLTDLSIEQLRRVICATEQSSNGTERNPWDLSLALVEQAGQLRLTFFHIKANAALEGSCTDISPNGKQQLAQQLSKMLFTVIQIAAGCRVDLGRAIVEVIAQKTAQHLDQTCSHHPTDCRNQPQLPARQQELQLAGTTSVPQSSDHSKCVSTSSATITMAVPEEQQQQQHQQQMSRGTAFGASSAACPASSTDDQHSLAPAVQRRAKNGISNGSSMCRSFSATAVPPAALLPFDTPASPSGGTAGSPAAATCRTFDVQQQQQRCVKPARDQDAALIADTSPSAVATAAEAPSSYDSVVSILSAADEVVLPVGKTAGFMTQHLAGEVLGSGGGVLGVQMPHRSGHNVQNGSASRSCYISNVAGLGLAGDRSNSSSSTGAATASAAGTLWLTGAVSPDLQGGSSGSCGSSSNSSNSQQSGSLISPCSSDSSTWSTTAALSSVSRSGALQNPGLLRQRTLDSLGALHPWQDARNKSNTSNMSYNMLGTNGNNTLLSQQRGVPGAVSLQNLDLAGLGLLSSSSDAAAAFAAARLSPAAALSSPAAKLAAVASLSAISPLPSPMPGSLGLSAPTPYVSHSISSSCINNTGSSGAMCLTPNLNIAAAAAARVASESPLVHSLNGSACRFLSLDSGVTQPPGMLQQSHLLCKPEPAATAAATACCSRCGGSHYGKCPPRAKCIRCYRKAHLGECWTRCVRCNLVHAPDKCKARPQQQSQQQDALTGVRRADTA